MVQLFWVHKAAALEDAHCKLGDDGQVALEVLGDDGAEFVIVFQGFDLFELAECVKGIVVELVDFFDVSVRYDDVGELLHVADAMRNSVGSISSRSASPRQGKRWLANRIRAHGSYIPDWKLGAHVVGRAYQSRLGQRASKDHQLAQADWARLLCNPSITQQQ